MRTYLFTIFFLLLSIHAYTQKNRDYIVLEIPKTIIKTTPNYLNLRDSINKERVFSPVSDYLGGLKPSYPIAISTEKIEAVCEIVECLSKFQIFTCDCSNYLIQRNDSIIEINTPEEFRNIFSPVEDKEEALSFAYVLCGFPSVKALYDFSFLNEKGTDYEIFRKELRPTSVKELTDGYEVILFSTYYGFTAYCSELVIYVSKQGYVKVLKDESLFHDKSFNLIIN